MASSIVVVRSPQIKRIDPMPFMIPPEGIERAPAGLRVPLMRMSTQKAEISWLDMKSHPAVSTLRRRARDKSPSEKAQVY